MDGDLVLIKLVKNRPVLWNKSVFSKQNANAKEQAWLNIAEKICADCEWIKNRWYNLQERFFTALRSKGNKSKTKFKYYDDMLFLTTQMTNATNKREPLAQKRPEFVITTRDIEEMDSSDPRVDIFEEIVSENEIIENNQSHEIHELIENDRTKGEIAEIFAEEECDSTEPIKMEASQSYVKRALHSESEAENIPSKKMRLARKVDVKIKEEPNFDMITLSSNISEPSSTQCKDVLSETSTNTIVHGYSISEPIMEEAKSATNNERCEDAIFGELITAMMRGMPETKKKQVKKEIMNILLS